MLLKYIESISLVLKEKRGDTVFDFPWCVMLLRGVWFWTSSRHLFFLFFLLYLSLKNENCNMQSPFLFFFPKAGA